MALNAWQKISRVLYGQPFGNGVDGAYSSATIPSQVNLSCSGTATSTDLTVSSTTLADGDLILIHQTRGTGAGQWEINMVQSGGGSASLTMRKALYYTYTDSGASQAQVIKIPQYSSVTVQSGTWTLPAWNANVGGILAIACKGTMTITGTISASGKGFVGGVGLTSTTDNVAAYRGEGTVGAGDNVYATAYLPNGNGGGASRRMGGGAAPSGAGGGGHATDGTDGDNAGAGIMQGGDAAGTADLSTLVLGGGAGGGFIYSNGSPGTGGYGGGIVVIMANNLVVNGSIANAGTDGTDTYSTTNQAAGTGGGAGGASLIVAKTATLGSGLITAAAGARGTISQGTEKHYGGGGSVGRNHIEYLTSYTGTTTPTLDAYQDLSLVTPIKRGFFI